MKVIERFVLDVNLTRVVAIEIVDHVAQPGRIEHQTVLHPRYGHGDIRRRRRRNGPVRYRDLLAGGDEDWGALFIVARRRERQHAARTGRLRNAGGALREEGSAAIVEFPPPARMCLQHRDTALDDGHYCAAFLAIYIELSTDGPHHRVAAANDEWTRLVLGDLEQGLPVDELDVPFRLGIADPDFRPGVQIDGG